MSKYDDDPAYRQAREEYLRNNRLRNIGGLALAALCLIAFIAYRLLF